MAMEHYFTWISIGFNSCCSLYFVLRFFSSKLRYFLFISLVGIMQSAYMLFSFPDFFRRFDSSMQPVLLQVGSAALSAVVLCYYLFLIAFLELKEAPILRGILRLGSLYMVAGILCKLLRLHVPLAYKLSTEFFIPYYIVIDVVVMTALLVYVIRARKKHLLYLLWAVISGAVVAVIIHATDHFGLAVSKYYVRQIEVTLGYVFFFLAILQKEKEDRAVRQRIQDALMAHELAHQQEIQAQRESIARDIHDEIGAGVSAIKLQAELINRKKYADVGLEADLRELMAVSEQINHAMREMLWNLKTDGTDVQTFVTYASDYCAQFLQKAQIGYHFQQSLANGDLPLTPLANRNLFLCVKEALNNVYKHSRATEVSFSAIQYDTVFEIVIKDNGIGLSHHPQAHDSNGIRNMEARIAAVQGDFTIRSQGGVEVSFHIPIAKNHTNG